MVLAKLIFDFDYGLKGDYLKKKMLVVQNSLRSLNHDTLWLLPAVLLVQILYYLMFVMHVGHTI